MKLEIDEKLTIISKQNETIEHQEFEKVKLNKKIKEMDVSILELRKEIENLRCEIGTLYRDLILIFPFIL